MKRWFKRAGTTLAAITLVAAVAPNSAAAQAVEARASLKFAGSPSFSVEVRTQIADYYRAHPVGAAALPPGIRKRLERGKPLPPGIARKNLPSGLAVPVPAGYEVVEVGLDVLLVEVATRIVHDVLMDVVR